MIFSVKITNNLSVVSKDIEIKTRFCPLKFGIICQLSVRMLKSKHDFLS